LKEVPTFKPALRWALPMRSNSSTLRSQKMNLLRIRDFALVASTASLLAACATTAPIQQTAAPLINPVDAMRYAAPLNEKFPVAPIDVAKVDPQYLRQIVDFPTSEPPGTVVVDTTNRFLYLVQEDGKALRYGVGVGKEGLEFKGTANIALKREWPRWTPTQDMIKREPERYAQWSGGMEARPLFVQGWQRYSFPHSRHHAARDDRYCRLVGLHPPDESRRDRPLRPCAAGRQRRSALKVEEGDERHGQASPDYCPDE